MNEADEKTAAMILRKFQAEFHGERHRHLKECADVSVTHSDMYNGTYGCETGCEYARLEATVACPHGHSYDYEYGTFGDLSDLIAELDEPGGAS